MFETHNVSDSYAWSSVRTLSVALAGSSVSYALSVSDFCDFLVLSLLRFALALSFCFYRLTLSDSLSLIFVHSVITASLNKLPVYEVTLI